MGTSRPALLAVAALALLAVGTALVGEEAGVWRALLAVPLVLFLPGYALAAAMFPARSGTRPLEGLVLGVGLSLATAAIGGLLLDRTPWGMGSASWAVLLGGVTLGATAVALVRVRGGAFTSDVEGAVVPVRAGAVAAGSRGIASPGLAQSFLLACAAITVVVAVAVARRGAEAEETATGFTQLWLVPATDTAGPGGESGPLTLGVRSTEPRQATYALSVSVGGARTYSWPALTLAPGQTWETTVSPSGAESGTIEAVLSPVESPGNVFRRVTLARLPAAAAPAADVSAGGESEDVTENEPAPGA